MRVLISLLVFFSSSLAAAGKPSARYVRVSLPGQERILTLAEVEVISGGENVAPEGTASQSSTAYGGVAKRALDGNEDPDYHQRGQTHTDGQGSTDPWWELDLGKERPLERVQIWNRGGLHARLEGFTLELLDADREPVFVRENNPAPDGSITFDFEGGAEISMADHGGNPLPVPIRPEPVPQDYRDPEPFAFRGGDTVAMIGNGLGDRMQHHGWTETLLQAAHPELELVFRNLSVTGDRIDHYPRSEGFTPMNEYLRRVGPDVIFAFFGYNESFAGAKGLADFEERLAATIERYRGVKPNGEDFPRIVLFSPIAHEDLGDPALPDGSENNRRLALYTASMQKVAGDQGVAFVDLFGPTKELYAASEEPLTLDGIHLGARGYRLVSEVIAEALVDADVAASGEHERIRDAVLEKNRLWHNRYRAIDGNDIWGGRSTLKFVDGQTNAEVLQHELSMLDVMTANRDPQIWARARGSEWKVDDGNVPGPVPVESNVGGGSKSSNPNKEGSLDYISGEEGLSKMTVPEGFEVNLFADEQRFPELVNPVQMQVDGKGRLWVAAWKTYPKWEPGREMEDALLILPDDDGDGVADRCVTFAEVHSPLGFEFWNGGVIVTSQPDILFLKDTDGDAKADVRRILLQGIGSSDTHHSANNLVLGPGGGIYWQSGIFLQHNHEHPWGPSLESTASGMYRLDPRRHTIAFHARNRPNPHGISFDGWGYHYANDGTSGRAWQVVPEGEGFTMRKLLEKEVRPVPANEVVSSANFPEAMQGNFLICNTIGFLGIKQYDLHRDGYEAGEKDLALGEVWGEPTEDLLVSSDENFRPTDAVFGADGALYVADWHNVIIGHMQHHIRDPNRDHRHGRIYRLRHADRPLQEPVAIDGEPIPSLLRNLEHPVLHVRHRTRVELSERKTDAVMAATKEWLADFDPEKKAHARPYLEALWLHQQHDVRDRELLGAVLDSPQPHAAEAAATVKHHWDVADPAKNVVTNPIEQEEEKREVDVPERFSKAEAEAYRLGEEVFHRDAHCVTCHQPNGQGLPKVYPPLVDSPWVTGDPERLTKLTLHGLWGPIEVKGKTWDPQKGVPPMTAFKALLDDEELAAVLTYVRNTWGNEAPPVSPATVERVRAATTGRPTFYEPEELLEVHPLER